LSITSEEIDDEQVKSVSSSQIDEGDRRISITHGDRISSSSVEFLESNTASLKPSDEFDKNSQVEFFESNTASSKLRNEFDEDSQLYGDNKSESDSVSEKRLSRTSMTMSSTEQMDKEKSVETLTSDDVEQPERLNTEDHRRSTSTNDNVASNILRQSLLHESSDEDKLLVKEDKPVDDKSSSHDNFTQANYESSIRKERRFSVLEKEDTEKTDKEEKTPEASTQLIEQEESSTFSFVQKETVKIEEKLESKEEESSTLTPVYKEKVKMEEKSESKEECEYLERKVSVTGMDIVSDKQIDKPVVVSSMESCQSFQKNELEHKGSLQKEFNAENSRTEEPTLDNIVDWRKYSVDGEKYICDLSDSQKSMSESTSDTAHEKVESKGESLEEKSIGELSKKQEELMRSSILEKNTSLETEESQSSKITTTEKSIKTDETEIHEETSHSQVKFQTEDRITTTEKSIKTDETGIHEETLYSQVKFQTEDITQSKEREDVGKEDDDKEMNLSEEETLTQFYAASRQDSMLKEFSTSSEKEIAEDKMTIIKELSYTSDLKGAEEKICKKSAPIHFDSIPEIKFSEAETITTTRMSDCKSTYGLTKVPSFGCCQLQPC
jgi:hypothetical protein